MQGSTVMLEQLVKIALFVERVETPLADCGTLLIPVMQSRSYVCMCVFRPGGLEVAKAH